MRSVNASEAVCQVCGDLLRDGLVECPRCDTVHHADCWTYAGACSTYACAFSGKARDVRVARHAHDVRGARGARDTARAPQTPARTSLEPRRTISLERPSILRCIAATLIAFTVTSTLIHAPDWWTSVHTSRAVVSQPRALRKSRAPAAPARSVVMAAPARSAGMAATGSGSHVPAKVSEAVKVTPISRTSAAQSVGRAPRAESQPMDRSPAEFDMRWMNGRQVLCRRSDPTNVCWVLDARTGWTQVSMASLANR